MISNPKIKKAFDFAKKAHEGQTRKVSGIPYFEGHVEQVYNLVKNLTDDENILCASLMHDVIEDCNKNIYSYENIKIKFGKEIADLVQELTSNDEEIRKIGKDKYLLKKMLKMTPKAFLVKLCDRYHNISDLDSNEQNEKFRIKYYNETKFIMNGLKERKDINDKQKIMIDKINQKLSEINKKFNIEGIIKEFKKF